MSEEGMADERSPHLSGIDCEKLIAGSAAAMTPGEQAKWREHLNGCEHCVRYLDQYRLAGERLLTLPMSGRPGNDCPDARKWADFATGLLDDAEVAAFLDHVSDCDWCGEMLKTVSEPERNSAIPQFSVNPGLIRDIARKASGEAHGKIRGPRFFSIAWKPALGLAAAILFALLAVWGLRLREPGVEQLVARAYEQNRTWPIRIPGAAYVPVPSQNRAGMRGNALLSEAEAKVSKALDEAPNNAHFTALKSRIDLVRHRYNDAIAPLETMIEAGNNSAELLLDLGSAHLARGLADKNASDLDAAVEDLGRILSREPDNQVALFNRAVALEELLLIDRAKEAWTHYLALDNTSGWAAEARDHLRRLDEKKKAGGGG